MQPLLINSLASSTTPSSTSMWDHLPADILSLIFSFLPPDSIACCISTCNHWRLTAAVAAATITTSSFPPWLLAVPRSIRHSQSCIFAYNPSCNRWHSLPLPFLPFPVRPVGVVASFLLCTTTTTASSSFLICNPLTRQHRLLPPLNLPRTNPAVGVLVAASQQFRIFVAGGASGPSYERTVEAYNSETDGWSIAGTMPLEFAVRLTVWTPNECVYGEHETMYWMTSARAYSVVGFDAGSGAWREVRVPLADRLQWAALVKRGNGRVGLVGGASSEGGGGGCVWELRGGDEWVVVDDLVPSRGMSGGNVKCAGGGEVVYLFKDVGGKMLVGSEMKCGAIEWCWVEGRGGCSVPKMPIKAMIMQPSLSRSPSFGEGRVGS